MRRHDEASGGVTSFRAVAQSGHLIVNVLVLDVKVRQTRCWPVYRQDVSLANKRALRIQHSRFDDGKRGR